MTRVQRSRNRSPLMLAILTLVACGAEKKFAASDDVSGSDASTPNIDTGADASEPNIDTGQEGSGTVDKKGGTLSISAGVAAGTRIDIPEGALQEHVEVSMDPIGEDIEVPDSEPAGPAVRLSPQGTKFWRPVRITIPVDELELVPGQELAIAHDPGDGTEPKLLWNVELSEDGSSVSADIYSFSSYQPTIVTMCRLYPEDDPPQPGDVSYVPRALTENCKGCHQPGYGGETDALGLQLRPHEACVYLYGPMSTVSNRAAVRDRVSPGVPFDSYLVYMALGATRLIGGASHGVLSYDQGSGFRLRDWVCDLRPESSLACAQHVEWLDWQCKTCVNYGTRYNACSGEAYTDSSWASRHNLCGQLERHCDAEPAEGYCPYNELWAEVTTPELVRLRAPLRASLEGTAGFEGVPHDHFVLDPRLRETAIEIMQWITAKYRAGIPYCCGYLADRPGSSSGNHCYDPDLDRTYETSEWDTFRAVDLLAGTNFDALSAEDQAYVETVVRNFLGNGRDGYEGQLNWATKIMGAANQCLFHRDGEHPDFPTDPCIPDPCLNGGTCVPGSGLAFTCTCPAGFSGPLCATNIDDCSPNPCRNGGTCNDGVNSHTCQCPPGYAGTDCETDIDDCSPDPCIHGVCADGVNSYTCTCAAGYSGSDCETDIDDCSPNPCKNGGTCADGVNGYTCTCQSGYVGTTCETYTTNEPPLAMDDTASITTMGGSVDIDVLANDSDSDGSLVASSVALTSFPANMTCTVNSPSGVVVCAAFPGAPPGTYDTVDYTVEDNEGLVSNTATITVNFDFTL